MTSFEKFITSTEPTPPADDDTFAAALQRAADVLDSPIITPDTESFEVLRVPFGRFSDGGRLAADATWSNGLSGRIIFAPSEPQDRGRIHATRKVVDTHWRWKNYTGNLSNRELARRLQADWPLDQNAPEYTDTSDDRAMYDWLQASLVPRAPYWQTERSYRQDQIDIKPGGLLHQDSASALTVRTYQDTLMKLRFTTTIQADKKAGPIRSHATVDEVGSVELRAFRHDFDKDRIVEIAIGNRAMTLGSMLILLERLIKEKNPI